MARFVPSGRIAAIQHKGPPVLPEPEARVIPGEYRLNLNESRVPASPLARAAMEAALAEAGFYPDHSCRAVTERLARTAGIEVERVVCGNGSSELLVACALAAVGPGDHAVLPTPTFPAIAKGVALAGGTVVAAPVRPDGIVDAHALLARLSPQVRLLYACTPNNPTGGAMRRQALLRLARETPDECLLVVDEAYFEYGQHDGAADAFAAMAQRQGPWVITRTFSKAYGLAGLRIGYALTSDRAVASALATAAGGFSVNRVAIAGAAAAFDDVAYMRAAVDLTARERERLAAGLRRLGADVLPSSTNFVLARTPVAASTLVAALAREKIFVQAVPWPDDRGAVRISVGLPAETDRVLAAIGSARE